MRLETYQLDDFQTGDFYWDLTVNAEPSVDYGGEDRAPVVVEVWNRGKRLPIEGLPVDMVEKIQDEVTKIWRWPAEREYDHYA